MDDFAKIIRAAYELGWDDKQFSRALAELPSEELADHIVDTFNRKEDAARFWLSSTYGYESEICAEFGDDCR